MKNIPLNLVIAELESIIKQEQESIDIMKRCSIEITELIDDKGIAGAKSGGINFCIELAGIQLDYNKRVLEKFKSLRNGK